MTVFRLFAWLYASTVFLAAAFAWYVDISLLNSGGEHMLPDMLLMLVTFPASLSLSSLFEIFPVFFSRPFTQLTWLTLCGVGQARILFVVTNPKQKRGS